MPSSASRGGELITVVGAAIIDHRGPQGVPRCLVAQRSAAMSHPLTWEFPGGKVEVDESLAGALRREIHEELAIEVEVGALLGRSRWVATAGSSGRRIALHVYRCRWLRGEIRLAEHRAWRWIRGAEITDLEWSPADRPLLTALGRVLNAPADPTPVLLAPKLS